MGLSFYLLSDILPQRPVLVLHGSMQPPNSETVSLGFVFSGRAAAQEWGYRPGLLRVFGVFGV